MSNEPLVVGPNRKITLTFSLFLANDGRLIDAIEEPATFVWGDESLLPGFQKALAGSKKGDKSSAMIPAREGFGERSEDNVQYFKPDVIDKMGIQPEEGMMISFTDDHRSNKGEADVTGIVIAVSDDWVTVDFNHPLAGRDLMIQFEIHDVQVKPQDLGISVVNYLDDADDDTSSASQ